MNALEKKIWAAAMFSVLVCYSVSVVIASLDSIKGAFDPTSARAGVVGGQAAPSK
jgi:hypothetical protein